MDDIGVPKAEAPLRYQRAALSQLRLFVLDRFGDTNKDAVPLSLKFNLLT